MTGQPTPPMALAGLVEQLALAQGAPAARERALAAAAGMFALLDTGFGLEDGSLAFPVTWLGLDVPLWVSLALGDFAVKVLIGLTMLAPYGALLSVIRPAPAREPSCATPTTLSATGAAQNRKVRTAARSRFKLNTPFHRPPGDFCRFDAPPFTKVSFLRIGWPGSAGSGPPGACAQKPERIMRHDESARGRTAGLQYHN